MCNGKKEAPASWQPCGGYRRLDLAQTALAMLIMYDGTYFGLRAADVSKRKYLELHERQVKDSGMRGRRVRHARADDILLHRSGRFLPRAPCASARTAGTGSPAGKRRWPTKGILQHARAINVA